MKKGGGSRLDRYLPFIGERDRFLRTVATPEPTQLRLRPGREGGTGALERLEGRGFRFEAVNTGFGLYRVVEEPWPLGNTLEHWLGLFYIQQTVTALAAPALGARPGERILDMAAAPGGKTIHVADLMESEGTLVAGDVSEKRIRGLLGNLYRTFQTNVVTVSGDGRRLGGEGLFDRVLLDAPCSGEGNLRKWEGELGPLEESYRQYTLGLQRGLLRRAVELVRPGGTVLYATCAFNPVENEGVVSTILEEWAGEVTVEPIELDAPHASGLTAFEGERFHPDVEGAWRLYPHHLDSGGLFMCRLRRAGDARSAAWSPVPTAFPGDRSAEEAAGLVAEAERQLGEVYGVARDVTDRVGWMTRGDSVWLTTARELPTVLWEEGDGVRFVSLGLRGMKEDPRTALRPTSDLLRWLGPALTTRVVDVPPDGWRALLDREPLDVETPERGFVALRLRGQILGRGRITRAGVVHEIPKAQARWLAEVLDEPMQ